MPRDQLFISYSHKDRKWRNDLDTHLKPYLRDGSIISWSDEQIAPGSEWFKEIQSALANSKVAVLLVSPHFLASDFIHEHELGPLLKEAEQGGVKILWVPVRDSAYRWTPLKNYQAVLSPETPLAEIAKAKRDRAWRIICEEIQKAVNPSKEPLHEGSLKDAAPQSRPTAAQNRERELSETPAAPATAMTLSPPVIATPPAEAEATAFDTRFYYRLTNDFLGQGKSLDVYNDGSDRLRMSESADSPGQLWKLVDRGDGKYYLRNAYHGNSYSLDVIPSGKKDTLRVAKSGDYTGQIWTLSQWGDGTFKLTNDYTGPEKSLGTYSNTHRPFLSTGNDTGQHWRLIREKEILPTAERREIETKERLEAERGQKGARRSNVEPDDATSNTSVGTVLDPIQKAQASLREARRAYVSLKSDAGNRDDRIEALHEWNNAAKSYFYERADAFSTKQLPIEKATYAEDVLSELADHHEAIGKASLQLALEPKRMIPPFIKFKNLQSFLREKEPEVAQNLRDRFKEVGLPTYGFEENEGEENEDSQGQSLEWRWFVVGCVFIVFAIGLVIWGISLRTLTSDQQRLLVWALALAAGFAASAITGTFNADARNLIPGIAITASSGCAVWLITFFFLFPESKVKPPAFPQEVSQTKADRDTNGKPELILKCRVEAWPAGYELTIQASDDDKFSHFVANEPIHPDNGEVIGPIALNGEPRTPTVWYRFVITPSQGPPLFGPVMSLEFPPKKK